jgi:hypothetical protein
MSKANGRRRLCELFRRRRRGSSCEWRAMVGVLENRSYLSTTFSGPTNYPGITTPTTIAVANFAGGSAGVAVAGYAPSTNVASVGVYLQSSGGFGTPTLYPFDGTPSGLAAGDFVNNGDQDFAAVDSSSNTLNVFLGDGAGNFSPGAGASLGGTAGDTALVGADFNEAGKVDIAAIDPGDNQVVTFTSSTGGEFDAGATVTVPSPIDLVAADFNRDGHADLAILSADGSVYIAINNGGGGFNAPVAYGLGSAGADSTSMVVADFGSDATPDLAILGSSATDGAASVMVLLNNGDGTFGAATVVATVPTNPVSILVGNFTGSGNTDLAVLDAEGGLTVIPGNGDGTFGATQTIFTNQLHVGAGAVAADFNGDGLTDIAYLDSSGGGFSELVNTTNGGLATPPATTSPIVPALPSSLPSGTFAAGQTVKPIKEVVTLTNSSKSTISGKTSITLTLSQTSGGAAADPVVATYSSNSLALKGGKSKTIPLKITSIPAGLDGSYYVRATVVDPSSESNAIASAARINIVPATIDLTGAFSSSPASATVGKPVALSFNVTNVGTIAAMGPLTVDVDTSSTAGIDSSSASFDVVTVKHIDLKPNGIAKIKVKKTATSGISSPFYVVVIVDPNDAYNDVDTTNNVFSSNAIAVL